MVKSYNLNFLIEYYGDDITAMKIVLKLYLEETPKELQQIESFLESNNMAEVKRLTHKIKTNVAMLGITDPEKFIEHIQRIPIGADLEPIIFLSYEKFKRSILSALDEIKKDFTLE